MSARRTRRRNRGKRKEQARRKWLYSYEPVLRCPRSRAHRKWLNAKSKRIASRVKSLDAIFIDVWERIRPFCEALKALTPPAQCLTAEEWEALQRTGPPTLTDGKKLPVFQDGNLAAVLDEGGA